MSFKVIEAKERFSELDIGAGQEADRTSFRCGNCSTVNNFTQKVFEQALFEDSSILSQERVESINGARKFERDNWEEFFDFKCSGCNNPVRVIYVPNEFRMGCHYYQLKQVIEVASG